MTSARDFHESASDQLNRLWRASPQVRDAMVLRCEQSGHEWEPGLTPMFQTVAICRWCDARGPFTEVC